MEIKDVLHNEKDFFDIQKRVSFTLYLADKTAKLLKVIYLITRQLEQRDPLVERLRSFSFDLRDRAENIKDTVYATPAFDCGELIRVTRTLLECVELLVAAGFLSSANGEVLSLEYKTIVQMAEALMKDGSLPELGPDLPRTLPSPSVGVAKSPVRKKVLKTQKESVASPLSNAGRRAQILSRLVPGEEYSIRHIVEGVPGVSSKTIQRELSAMVFEGILVKKGERRWSTYARAL